MAKKNNNLNKDNLHEELSSLREKVRVICFDKSGAKVKNTKETKELKKKIARVLTEINKNIKNKQE